MSQQDKKEAAEKARLAAQQMKHASNNAGAAAEASAEFVKDEVVENVSEAKNRALRIGKRMVYSEAGRGVLMIGLGLISVGIGVKKLQTANQIGKNIRENLAKAG